jgi:phosphatidylglycerophosphate synthase
VTRTVGWLIIAVSGALLLLLAALTRHPATGSLPTTAAERAAIWQQLHNAPDVDPLANPLQRWFTALTYGIATPLARIGVLPDVLTLIGLWIAGLTVAIARHGALWPVLAGVVLLLSSITDGVDGAVAGMLQRSTPRGYVLDSVVDRLAEACFLAAVVVAGGSFVSAVLAMSAIMLFEYTRARAAHAAQTIGVSQTMMITVGERPTRVLGCAIALIASGLVPSSRSFIGKWSLVLVAVVTVVGWLQLSHKLFSVLTNNHHDDHLSQR